MLLASAIAAIPLGYAMLSQPCSSAGGLGLAGGGLGAACTAAAPTVVNPNGLVDLGNSTLVNLDANLTGAGLLGGIGAGAANDSAVLANGTRIIFNSQGVIATVDPTEGKIVFSNGTVVTVPICQGLLAVDPALPHGLYGNGTAWFTTTTGSTLVVYPDGTCRDR